MDRRVQTAIRSKLNQCLPVKLSVPIVRSPAIHLFAAIFERGRCLRDEEHTVISKIAGYVDDPVLENIPGKAWGLAGSSCRPKWWVRNHAIEVPDVFRKVKHVCLQPDRLRQNLLAYCNIVRVEFYTGYSWP